MKIGIIGTGAIVENFLSALEKVDNVKCIAICSRKEETGKAIAEKFQIEKIYTDYDKMLNDSEINFIYIASPNSLHFEYAKKALDAGKNVIGEKPFTSTDTEVKILIDTAKSKNLMLFEAITTIYLPNYKRIKENLEKIGNIKIVQCNYSQYSKRYTMLMDGELPNVFNPKFSGGALQDINIYNLHFVMKLFGEPEKVNYFANKHANGIDTSGILILKYPHFICECVGAKDSKSQNFAQIQGDKGYIHVENEVNSCKSIKVSSENEEFVINEQNETNNMIYELKAFSEIFKNKDYNKCYEALEHSYSVMKILTAARKDAGIVFDADNK